MNPSITSWRGVALFTGLLALAGCRDWRKTTTTAPTTQTAATEAITPNEPRDLGEDANDDPRAPAYLPQTQKGGTWIKREAVKVYGAGDLAKAMDAAEATRCSYFRVKSAARCAYAFNRGKQPSVMAGVLAIDTLSTDDAYGILTCQSASPETYKIGSETRVEHGGGLSLHCCQGRTYIRVSSQEQDGQTTEEMIRLLMQVCAKIGRENPPAILSALPPEGRRPGKCWLVRHLASLPPDAVELGYSLDASRVSTILGLGRDTLMGVASYDFPEGQRPNTVWVVLYPSIKAAQDAYARYSRLINGGKEAVARSASVLPVQGSYLIGTWTAEEESQQYMIPTISKLLPN